MNTQFSHFLEYEDDAAIFGLYDEKENDETLYGKFITVPRHEPYYMVYFKYIRDMRKFPVKYCRISMGYPGYLDSDFILTKAERDLIVNKIKDLWDQLVAAENSERRDNNEPEIIIDSIPDYSKLKVCDEE